MSNIWRDLARPIHALAPMEDVTDTVFRRIVASCGRPDLFFTEFIHTEIVLDPRPGRPGVTPRLRFTEQERPLIAQIWGTDPEQFARAARHLAEMGFDGVDINMGCPVRRITKKGACAALIRRPGLAAELIAAAREGGLPVSVKTRIGYEHPDPDWVEFLLEQQLDGLVLYGRTVASESEGGVDWEALARAAAQAREMETDTAILGNGEVNSRDEIDERCLSTGLDGIVVGRGALADPYLFATDGRGRFCDAPEREKIDLLTRHMRLSAEVWGDERDYEILKKFYKAYLESIEEADWLRKRLYRTHSYDEAETVIAEWHAGIRKREA